MAPVNIGINDVFLAAPIACILMIGLTELQKMRNNLGQVLSKKVQP